MSNECENKCPVVKGLQTGLAVSAEALREQKNPLNQGKLLPPGFYLKIAEMQACVIDLEDRISELLSAISSKTKTVWPPED